MRCSGSPKCNCTLFQGKSRAKRCKSCHHDRGSHYEANSDHDTSDDGDNSSDHGDSDNHTNDDSNDNSDSDTVKQQSTSVKNKMTVSSLLADLIDNGESSRVEVENARREAKAGLTRQKVGSTLTGS